MSDLEFPTLPQVAMLELTKPEAPGICDPQDMHLQQSLSGAIESLTPYGFAFVDLELSEHEQFVLSKIKVQFSDTLNLYSKLETLPEVASQFMKNIALRQEEADYSTEIASIIARISLNVIASSGYEDGQVAIVTYLKDPHYYPFWHVDKNHNELMGQNLRYEFYQAKKVFICALKGETTLFQKSDLEQRSEFNKLANDTTFVYGYSYLDYVPNQGLDKLFRTEEAISPKPGQCSVHFSGYDFGTIHATPNSDERLILIITPGESNVIKAFDEYIADFYSKYPPILSAQERAEK